MMRRLLMAALFLLCFGSSQAWALNCSSNPFTLTEGTTAFASQVMANFNNLLTCANTVLGKFTGPASSTTSNAVCFTATDGQTGKDCGAAIDGAAWTAYVPVVTCQAGTLTTSSPGGKWKRIGKTIFFTASVLITTNGTCAGNMTIDLPTAAGSGTYRITGGKNTTGEAGTGSIAPFASTMLCNKYDGTYLGGDGAVIVYSGDYESN